MTANKKSLVCLFQLWMSMMFSKLLDVNVQINFKMKVFSQMFRKTFDKIPDLAAMLLK